MSNMYSISRNEGFDNLKIHHVGGLWIWIFFQSTNAHNAFQENESLKNLSQAFKNVTPSFIVDERLVWIEISGLSLCAWGSAEKIQVEINSENFMAYVQEIRTWSISILDDFTAAQPSEDEREVPKDDNSVYANLEDGIVDIINDLHDNIGHKGDNQDYTNSPNKEKDDDRMLDNNKSTQQVSNDCNSNEFSRPPGFENHKRHTPSSNCSTSFAKFRKKDIKGFSLINEMTRLNEVGDSLGYDAWLYFSQTHADMFNTFITNNDLIELPMGSRSFTWMNKSGSKLRKLDRFLFSNIVIKALPDAHVIALDKLWPDHNPILFQCNKVDYGPTLFRLFPSWFNHDGFDDFISNEWNSFGQSNSNQILMSHEKFKNPKAKIKPWVRDVKSTEHCHKKDMLLALKNLEVKIDSNFTTDEDRESHIEFLHEIDKIDRFDSLDLFQKSRINWDIEGDENSKFFHGIEKFELHDSSNALPSTSFSSTLTVDDHSLLEKDVTLDEIKSAVWNCGNDKAPGPDGFTFSFIKRYCDILNPDIMEFVSTFFNLRRCLPVLIHPLLLSSLSQEQSAFIPGRQILNGPFMLSEMIDWYKKNDEVNLMASNNGCSPGFIPFTYLGLPIGTNMNLFVNWKTLIDRFDTRLSKWKSNLLSIGGHLTLKKRLISNDNVLWVKIIKAFHGQEGGFDSLISSSNTVWSKIVGSSNFLHWNGILPNDSIRFRVGCGSSIRLWKDIWADRLPHRSNFSSCGIDIPCIGCPLCNAYVESSNHIFFDCDNAKVAWDLVRTWSNVSFPMCDSFDQWKVWFHDSFIFGHHPIKRSVIFNNIHSYSYSWLHHRDRMAYSWTDWLKSPLMVSSNALG
uniref:Reverse transcriptase zinc-binding domain-containing protein n=1 Tax=Tanacetum cinerariifolium TaxID=118510 RepID=A0A699H0X8_TANCI|nr:hypothetical protein [Tanacetum cinerariifolium]